MKQMMITSFEQIRLKRLLAKIDFSYGHHYQTCGLRLARLYGIKFVYFMFTYHWYLPGMVAKRSQTEIFKNSSSEESCLDPGSNPALDYNVNGLELEIICCYSNSSTPDDLWSLTISATGKMVKKINGESFLSPF